MRHPKEPAGDFEAFLGAAGKLWSRGVPLDGLAPAGGRRRLRVPLPTYPFEPESHWIAPVAGSGSVSLGIGGGEAPESVEAPRSAASQERPADAPREGTERLLAAIWEELLGRSPLGRHDDFFDLGGHSLLATRVAAHVRRRLRVDLPLDAFFEAPTLAALAARVDQLAATGTDPEEPLLEPVPRDRPLPLSHAQNRLFFLALASPGDRSYNMPFAFRLRGPTRLALVGRALTSLVARHEVLRTTFHLEAGEAVQAIAPPAPLPLPVVDLAGLPAGRRDAEAARAARRLATAPLDLQAGPVLRALVASFGPQDRTLAVSVHHVATDGWSSSVVFEELVELYDAAAQGRAPRLRELPVQYADYAVWQRRWLDGGLLERQIEVWRRRLDRPPTTELPPDRPRPAARRGRGGVELFDLDEETVEGLRRLAQAEGASLFMVLMAGLAVAVSSVTGEDDLVLGTDFAGRSRSQLEGLVGLFVNQATLRFDLAGATDVGALVSRAREVTLEAHAHQEAPFDRLVEALDPPRDPGRTPFFQIKMVLQNVPVSGRETSSLEATPVAVDHPTAKFDLLFNLFETGRAISANCEYDADLYSAATVRSLVERLRAVLDSMGAGSETPVERLFASAEAAASRLSTERAERRRSQRSLAVRKVRRRAVVPAASEGDGAGGDGAGGDGGGS
jgi:hypothetical protein